jgi:hypothetical protein
MKTIRKPSASPGPRNSFRFNVQLHRRLHTFKLRPIVCFAALFLLAACLATSAHAGAVFTTLHTFTGTNDGANPIAALAQGSDGYLYGTTEGGGTNGFVDGTGGPFVRYGTVFKISTNGIFTSLYSFNGTNDGGSLNAPLVQGSDGYFYGQANGAYTFGVQSRGTVFKMNTNGVLTILATLEPLPIDFPQGALVQASDGYFYGTTFNTVFKIGTNESLTTLWSFQVDVNTAVGFDLQGALVQDANGLLYLLRFGRRAADNICRLKMAQSHHHQPTQKHEHKVTRKLGQRPTNKGITH